MMAVERVIETQEQSEWEIDGERDLCEERWSGK